jgi:hypothetical protein
VGITSLAASLCAWSPNDWNLKNRVAAIIGYRWGYIKHVYQQSSSITASLGGPQLVVRVVTWPGSQVAVDHGGFLKLGAYS